MVGAVFSVDQLMDRASKLIEQCKVEAAVAFLERALEQDRGNVAALEMMAETLMDLGREKEAQLVLQELVVLAPTRSPFIYMNLGQMSTGADALQWFTKGTELMATIITANHDDDMTMRLSCGYCSMVELYMTDLCDDPSAESSCENLLSLALQLAPSNPEAHQTLATFRLIQNRVDDANQSISACLDLINAIAEEEGAEHRQVPFGARVELAKMCIELDRFADALDIIDLCLSENDDPAELWLMAALCYLKEDDIESATDYVAHVLLKFDKAISDDNVDAIVTIVDVAREQVGDDEASKAIGEQLALLMARIQAKFGDSDMMQSDECS